jgi:hypothetical protein
MKTSTAKKLRATFEWVETMFPDKSTEFLLEVAAQEASRVMRTPFDCSDIAEALVETGRER